MTTPILDKGAENAMQEGFDIVATTKAVSLADWRFEMLEKSGLPPLGRLVLLVVSLHGADGAASACPTKKRLSLLTGMDERTISKYLGAGKAWLPVKEKGKHRGKPTVYGFSVPQRTIEELSALLAARAAGVSQQESPSLDVPLSERGTLESTASDVPLSGELGTLGAPLSPSLSPTPPIPDNNNYTSPRVCAREGVRISYDVYEAFNRAYSDWGSRPGAKVIAPWLNTGRDITDANLRGFAQAHGEKPASVVAQAIFEVVTYMSDKRYDQLADEQRVSHGRAGFSSYFSKALRSKINEISLAEKQAKADAEVVAGKAKITLQAEEHIASMRERAYSDGIAANKEARRAKGETAANRFSDEDKKVAVVKGQWIDGRTANTVLDSVPGSTAEQLRGILVKADGVNDAFFVQRQAFGEMRNGRITVTKILDWCRNQLQLSRNAPVGGGA